MDRSLKQFCIGGLIALSLFAFGCGRQQAPEVQASTLNPAFETDPKLRDAEEIIAKMPDSPTGYNRLAAVYIKNARQSGDFSLNTKAETAVDKALSLDVEDVPARKLKASLQLTFHRFAEALQLGEKMRTDYPADPFVYGVLTDANAELGNYKAAVEAAQKMVDLKPNTSSYARVGHMRSLHGDHKGAIEALTTAARSADPQDKEEQAWCVVQVGDELWKNGKYPESEKAYDEALGVFPDFYLALAGKGRVRAAQGDMDGAIKLLTDAQNRVPNVETVILLGDIYTLQNDPAKAKQQYDLVEVIEQKLGVAGDQKRLALMWADQNIKPEEALAITELEFAARKDILTADAYAWSLYRNGRFAEAKTAIEKAMALKTKDARILYHAGMIEKALGDKREAARLLAAALKLNPKFDLIQTATAAAALKELS